MGEPELGKRHCWECLRRCLVCDSTRPACNRCTAAGTSCPGYSQVKPTRLRWLAPGTVRSRVSKPNRHSSMSAEPSERSVCSRNSEPPRPSQPSADHVSISRFGLYTDVDALVHGAEYYNVAIFPDLCPVQELGSNPSIYRISPELIREASSSPDYLRFAMLCMTLSHRMNRTRGDPGAHHKDMAERFYKYRGDAIRSLREFISVEGQCTADVAVAGIVSLLLADAQQAASLNWRPHVEAAINLVHLRGGLAVVAASRILQPHLLFLSFVAVIGNTTCPASSILMAEAHLGALDAIMNLSNTTVTSFQMCAPALFAEIIRINHLRVRATVHGSHMQEETDTHEALAQEAYAILERIHHFSPEHWADIKPRSRDDWTLMGRIYQTAVALYCVSSLQSLAVLPTTTTTTGTTTTTPQSGARARLLHQLLEQAVASQRIQRFTLWPLVVLGVVTSPTHGDGAAASAAARGFVAAQLPVLSRCVGTYVPLTAKSVLERFWASSGGTGQGQWDACFDRPYAFFTQLAVDTSRILAD
ncbi:C6 zinc finger domain-containing protein [Parathielavia hyrcaniae]|uniref:C6 zinc finger domain-containing protein n=1 Tax=Parathielavia hyrcaniae TaxID=113614 RepID=A0AAN6SZL9_9PEZI|nr:C6 zinc finger domain-containing protein [Parathielavia hyrcaniae]